MGTRVNKFDDTSGGLLEISYDILIKVEAIGHRMHESTSIKSQYYTDNSQSRRTHTQRGQTT